ncbi:pirin [Massilia sp. Root133]|uniref:Pirin family protein n=1 Tax=Massilia cellulosiltytica TaxID=2683234 RepID=A0A7X3G233_9BURK|nr:MULTISPECIES: pirin family protein [Telluria group]KQY01468.1 pirin [Massilia sp. Root133]KQZ48274.1 pirin [Massilia sp. Root1485]MVW62286.1 pirin family protein [Telluria cellulosilytica]
MTQQVQTQAVATSRGVERLVGGQFVMDGAGVKINRVLTQTLQRRLDPFLMLDAFGSDKAGDYIAGFPEHPHRGFETVTYMLTGNMRHRDSAGHEGAITNGGVQWMTAGRGVIHSEMPEQNEGLMEGFQLWLNLAAKDKMSAPWYRDIPAEAVPRFTLDSGATVQVIAGSSHGVAGAVQREVTEPLYLDIELPAGATFEQALPAGHNAFLYVFRGEVVVEGKAVPQARMAILDNAKAADGVRIKASQPSRLLLIAGRPLNEPIAQYGPFVMNTQAEVFQAVEDFRNGKFTDSTAASAA